MADIRGQVQRHIAAALNQLTSDDRRLTDGNVHDVRKALKGARAGMRLMRDSVGKSAYSTENAKLRDAARPLGQLRDVAVLLQVLQRVMQDCPGASRRRAGARRPASGATAALAAAMRAQLQAEGAGLRDKLHQGAQLRAIRHSLEQVLQRLAGWPVPTEKKLRRGLRRIYLRGGKVLEEIQAGRTGENLHEWRKQVKYLAQAIRTLDSADERASSRLNHLAARAESLAERLGDDHDLALLAGKLAALSGRANGVVTEKSAGGKSGVDKPGVEKSAGELFSRIAQRRRKLQRKALRHGRKLYRIAPRKFARGVFRCIRSGAPA